jgi:hypothetical protein
MIYLRLVLALVLALVGFNLWQGGDIRPCAALANAAVAQQFREVQATTPPHERGTATAALAALSASGVARAMTHHYSPLECQWMLLRIQ